MTDKGEEQAFQLPRRIKRHSLAGFDSTTIVSFNAAAAQQQFVVRCASTLLRRGTEKGPLSPAGLLKRSVRS